MKAVDWKEFWDIFKDKIVSLEDLNEMPKGPIIFFRFPEETK
jgi:hypothetical protein